MQIHLSIQVKRTVPPMAINHLTYRPPDIQACIYIKTQTAFELPPWYLALVASPPLICLSALFSSSIFFTSSASSGFTRFSLSVTSLCLVVSSRNDVFHRNLQQIKRHIEVQIMLIVNLQDNLCRTIRVDNYLFNDRF